MSTKTKVDLTQVPYFYYTSDLNIEPMIPKVKHSGDFYELKTTKDEDVQLVNGELTVVTNEVTTLKAKHSESDNVYSAENLRQEIEKIALLAKSNKASLNGQVVIKKSDDDDTYEGAFRILVTDNRVEVQEGHLVASWPDGTTSRLPKGDV